MNFPENEPKCKFERHDTDRSGLYIMVFIIIWMLFGQLTKSDVKDSIREVLLEQEVIEKIKQPATLTPEKK